MLLSLLLPVPLASAQEAAKAEPPVSILFLNRQGRVTPIRTGSTHTGAGLIDVAQPSPDVVVITMTGVAVATDHPWWGSSAVVTFDLEQCFDVVFDQSKVKAA